MTRRGLQGKDAPTFDRHGETRHNRSNEDTELVYTRYRHPCKAAAGQRYGRAAVPAILAGLPDVAIGAANMDLAFRGALVDLSEFEDFKR